MSVSNNYTTIRPLALLSDVSDMPGEPPNLPASSNTSSLRNQVDIVRSYIDANNRRDLAAVLSYLDSCVTVIGPTGGTTHSSRSSLPLCGQLIIVRNLGLVEG